MGISEMFFEPSDEPLDPSDEKPSSNLRRVFIDYLVNVYIANWKTTMLLWVNQLCPCPFSIAMIKTYQRVYRCPSSSIFWPSFFDALGDFVLYAQPTACSEDPIYIVSAAYLSNQECNYSDYDGFQMDEGGGWRWR